MVTAIPVNEVDEDLKAYGACNEEEYEWDEVYEDDDYAHEHRVSYADAQMNDSTVEAENLLQSYRERVLDAYPTPTAFWWDGDGVSSSSRV